MTKELEERLALLERQLAEATQTDAGKTKARHKLSYWKMTMIAATAIIVIGGALFYASYNNQPRNPVPATIRTQLPFSIYLPDSQTYKIDTSSFSISNGIVTFSARKDNDVFTVTEQAQPEKFDISRFTVGVTEPKIESTPQGKLLTGTVLDKKMAILATNDKLLVSVHSDKGSLVHPRELLAVRLSKVSPEN
jgi:hypothetical protein